MDKAGREGASELHVFWAQWYTPSRRLNMSDKNVRKKGSRAQKNDQEGGGLVEPPPFISGCAGNSGTGANAFCVEPTF